MALDMTDDPISKLRDLVEHIGRYPEEAFHFVREGLGCAADQVHGSETEAYQLLQHFMAINHMDWNDLVDKFHAGELPPKVLEAIEEAGGYEKLNRHVSGRELCWSLRDYAIKKWGMLARAVLGSWNITCTDDFGRIVFGFIEFEMMQGQEGDTVEEFTEVFSFDEAFAETFHLRAVDGKSDAASS